VSAVRTWPDIWPAENRTLGWDILAWTAGIVDGKPGSPMLLQPDGPNAGEAWEYTPEQQGIILRLYEIDDNGKFVHRRVVLRRMKGWGKDPFLASLAFVELCGPCRFQTWYNGMPVAVQHSAPWIDIAAVSQGQTDNTMRLFPGMVSDRLKSEYDVDMGKEIIYARNGLGRIKAITTSPKALEGGRQSMVIANETQHWLANNDGLEMMAVIQRNLAKSRDGSARVFEITNAHLPDEGSVAEQTYLAWTRSNGHLPGVYYDSLEAGPIDDLTDVEAVKRGLIEARGDSVWLDADRLAAEIADPTSRPGRSYRFYLNNVRAAGDSFLPDGSWNELPEATIPQGKNVKVVLALDGSLGGERGDSTALVACSIEARPIIEVVGHWAGDIIDEDGNTIASAEWRVPMLEVEDLIRDCAARRWNVVELTADPYAWQRSLQVLEAEKIPVAVYPQSDSRMMPATKKIFDAVVNRLVAHDHNSALANHINNARTKETLRGFRLIKPTKTSSRKIDLAIAATMAHDRATTIRDGVQESEGVLAMSLNDFPNLTPENLKDRAEARKVSIAEILERAKKAQDERVAAIIAKAKNSAASGSVR
jgi:hypothetical protein